MKTYMVPNRKAYWKFHIFTHELFQWENRSKTYECFLFKNVAYFVQSFQLHFKYNDGNLCNKKWNRTSLQSLIFRGIWSSVRRVERWWLLIKEGQNESLKTWNYNYFDFERILILIYFYSNAFKKYIISVSIFFIL